MLKAAPAIVALVLLALCARGEEVWRMAGTFNSWDTQAAAWTLAPDPDRPGVHTLDKRLAPGRYQFKFVRNGDWGAGHLGDAGGGRLVQPGSDIELVIDAEAVYRVTLDAAGAAWGLGVASLEAPVMVAQVYGTPVAGTPVVVSFARSLSEGGSGTLVVKVEGGPGVDVEAFDAYPASVTLTPLRPGVSTVQVTLVDGQKRSTTPLTLYVQPRREAELVGRDGATRRLTLEPQWDGTARAVLNLEEDLPLREVVFTSNGRPTGRSGATVVPAGTYALELVGDRPTSTPASILPPGFVAGHWRALRVDAPWGVRTAHLIGDFNAWAGPGSAGMIELTPVTQGDRLTFGAVARLPEGAHRYQVLFDGQRREPDPGAGASARLDDGSPASLMIIGPQPGDFPPPREGKVELAAVAHDPSATTDVRPISAGLGLFDVSVRALPGDVAQARLVLGAEDALRRVIDLTPRRDAAGFDRWEARVLAGGPEVEYAVELEDAGAAERLGPFRFTLEDPTPRTPDWAKGAVWYQIFPERFRNADPNNDPHGRGVFQMPWTADWYETQPGEEEQWRRRAGLTPDEPLEPRQGGDLYHWIFDRRYGGDLQGVEEKLDWIKELGVTAIYLNPVFEADSMHKYDASSFHHIDDNFAPTADGSPPPASFDPIEGETIDPTTWRWTAADRYFVERFLPACRERGIRVVIDGVFNHTGRNFWAFRDVLALGSKSRYADWFYVDFDENGRPVSWVAWDGPSGWLPKFRQTDDGNLIPAVRQHIMDITRRWMDPNADGDPSDGVDGWRLDVALDIGLPFWEEWRSMVKWINPDAIIIAEIWHDADEYLTGSHFDTHMNYPFARAVTDWLAVRPGMTSEQLAHRLAPAFDNPEQVNLIHQNLVGSHDTDRFVSQLFNPGREYDEGNRIQDNGPGYRAGRPDDRSFTLSRLGVAIQATYTGAPMVYYGDEVGAWGADDPTDRKPIPWPDLGAMEDPDERFDAELRDHYVRWFTLRSDPVVGPMLRYGRTVNLSTGHPDVFAFERRLEGRRVVVVVNRGDQPYDASTLLGGLPGDPAVGPLDARWWLDD